MEISWEEAYWEACKQLGSALVQKSIIEQRSLIPADKEAEEAIIDINKATK